MNQNAIGLRPTGRYDPLGVYHDTLLTSEDIPMTPEYESQGYLLDDYRLFHLSEPQRGRIDFHYHEFCKLLMLRSGSGGYWVNGQRYALQAGDAVLIGSHCVHRPEFEPGVPYERIIIYISPEFLKRQSDAGCPLEELFTGPVGPVLRPSEKEQRRIFVLFHYHKI